MHAMHLTPTRSPLRRLAALACAALSSSASAQLPHEDVVDVPAIGAGLCVSNVFQSHMVLQRDAPITLWGWADPGATVTAQFGGAEASATAGPDRAWRVVLPAQAASAAARTLSIRSGPSTLALDDVLVGDVWVLGGQSNMEFELAKVENGALEIVSAHYPGIRVLTVPYGVGLEPRRSFARLHEWSDWFGQHFRKGDWDVCTPEIARELSAIGFAFARRVHMASGVPIGVIDASRGGTTVEAWTPDGVLRSLDGAAVRAKLAAWDERVATWDPHADLARRVTQHAEHLERRAAEGRPVPEHERAPPQDLAPGPAADPNLPGASFAAMIGPLVGLRVKGALFHQGYNNALEGMPGVRLYEDVFPDLIRAWREAFADPKLPFGILSLCTEGPPQTREAYLERMLDAGVYIRAVQYRTFLTLVERGDTNVGYASTFDLRRSWFHPQVKLPAGERLARWALATQYGFGEQLSWRPPALVALERRAGALVLRLDTDVSDPEDGAITGFAIAGEDRRFQPADVVYGTSGEDGDGRPRIDRKQLVLTSPLVPAPVHFRYAWARNPLANLQATGNLDLPFATQRSDAWPLGAFPLGVLAEEPERELTGREHGTVLAALRAEDLRRRLAEAQALLDAAKQ